MAESASHMHDAARITRLINAEIRAPRLLGLAVTIVLGSMLLNVAHADVEIVAETGVQAPGEAPGVTFSKFNRAPAIGGNGHVVLSGELSGPGISSTNRSVIFAGLPRFLHKVAQRGHPAPGTDPGVTFLDVPRLLSGTYNRFVVADSGDVAFFGRVQGTGVGGTNQYGVWAELDGVLTLIARAGQALPGGSTLTIIHDFVFTDAGVVLFVAVDPGTTAILVYRGGALSVVFAAGDPAPGFIDCTINGLFRPVSSPSGKIGFRANLLRNFVGALCPVTMYIEDAGTFIRALSTGDLTPTGLPAGTVFAGFNSGANIQLPKINERGDLIVHSQLAVPDEPGSFASAWIARTNGDLELLAIEDETLLSDPSIQINSLSGEGVNNATGFSAMRATLSTGFAILAGEPRSSYSYSPITNIGAIGLTEVARTGEPVAGGMGGLTLVMCEGQPVNVIDPFTGLRVETPSAMLPLSGVSAPDGSGSGDGLSNPFSDTGQVVARVTFLTSATTAIVISPPEPVDTDGDGTNDITDNCPLVANPGQGPASFGQTVQAANTARFEWPTAVSFVAAHGAFTTSGDIGTFTVTGTYTGFGRDLPAADPLVAGTGIWYLLRPDCVAGSWISDGGAEFPGRDSTLPSLPGRERGHKTRVYSIVSCIYCCPLVKDSIISRT